MLPRWIHRVSVIVVVDYLSINTAMKAPDKIYIEIDNKAHVYFGLQPENAEEYIRKDALLEWANGWLAFKRSGIVVDDGFSYAMEELIKKLNEM